MSDAKTAETKPAEGKEAPAAEKTKKKKSQPTNCAQSNKRIRRKDWYYRNGQDFSSKQCFLLYAADQAKKKEAAKPAPSADAQPTAPTA